MSDSSQKKITIKSKSPADYARYLAKIRAEAAESLRKAEVRALVALEVGDVMADGAIYAGISPDTHQRMYAAPADAPMTMDFNTAANYAQEFDIGGKKDFRVPTADELNVLFENRKKGALKGTFNLAGFADPAGWYWSSTPNSASTHGRCQRFSDGLQSNDFYTSAQSVRYVRS